MITLQLPPETEAKLLIRPTPKGLSVEQYLLNLIDEIEREHEAVPEGLVDIAAGRTRLAADVFAELHERYGIPG